MLDIHSIAKPGEIVYRTLSVSCMPDGSEIGIPLIALKGIKDGPVLSVFGGVHGNEYEGPLAIREVTRELESTKMAGVFVGVPVANVPAFNFCTRENPIDRKDLARAFPGRPNGTISEKMAYIITERIVSKSDYVIDLHSMGDGWIETLNLVGYFDLPGELGKRSLELAMSFPVETLFKRGPNIGRLADASIGRSVPVAGTECTGGGVESNVQIYYTGIINAMKNLKMIRGKAEGLPEKRRFIKWCDVETDKGGFLKTYAGIGEWVTVGKVLGEITNIFGDRISELKAPIDGILCARSIKPVARPGERVFVLGLAEQPKYGLLNSCEA